MLFMDYANPVAESAAEEPEVSVLEGIEPKVYDESMSIDGMFLQAELEGTMNWNMLLNAMNEAEISCLKAGKDPEAVMEAVDFKAMKNRFVDWLKRQWSKFKGAIDSAKARIDELMHGAQKWVKAFDALPADKQAGSVKVSMIGAQGAGKYYQWGADEWHNAIASATASDKSEVGTVLSFRSYTDEEAVKNFLEKKKNTKISYSGSGEKLAEDWKTKVKETTVTYKQARDFVANGRISKVIEDGRKQAQSSFENMIKQFQNAKSGEKNVAGATKVLNWQESVARKQISTINKAASAMCHCANANFNKCCSILRKACSGKGEKKEEKKATEESVDMLSGLAFI